MIDGVVEVLIADGVVALLCLVVQADLLTCAQLYLARPPQDEEEGGSDDDHGEVRALL